MDILNKNKFLVEKLGLKYLPVALLFSSKKPENALSLKKTGTACIAPLIFSAAKGKTVAIDKNSTGYVCSAFYLGFGNWIFDRIEDFLSHSSIPLPGGRECERFVKTPQQAKEYLTSLVPKITKDITYVFKPLEEITENEKPEVIILYCNPDQISAIVFLIQYNHPNNFNRIVTGFSSSCAAVTTFPLSFNEQNEMKAFWGSHDPAQRLSFPKEITSIAMPYKMYVEICENLEESFLITHNWEKVLNRINN